MTAIILCRLFFTAIILLTVFIVYKIVKTIKESKTNNNMEQITIDNINYILSFDEIKIGDKIYNPLSGVIMKIDEEDDINYVNDTYYLVTN